MEYFCQFFLLAFAAEEWLDDFQKFADGGNSLRSPCLNDDRCQFPAVLQFAVQIKNIGQLFFFVGIHDVGSGQAGTLVHTHIQCPVEAEGESPFAVIKVMGRYAEVGKYGIHFFDAVIA